MADRSEVVDAETMLHLRYVIMKSHKVVAALAHRWTIVDCTPDEEVAIRELNDALQSLYRHDRSFSDE